MDNPAATDAIIAVSTIIARDVFANVNPAISPIRETIASCMPKTTAPAVLHLCVSMRIILVVFAKKSSGTKSDIVN